MRESQSTVNKLTHQITELQEVVNSVNGLQDFQNVGTASSSGPAHAPGAPSVFPSFSGQLRCDSCHRSKNTGFKLFPGGVFDDPVLMLQQPHQQEAQKLQRELPSTKPEDTWSTETSKQVVRKSNPSLNRDFSDFCRPWNCLSLRRNCIRELSWPSNRRITFRSCRVKHTLCPLLSSIERQNSTLKCVQVLVIQQKLCH